MAIIKAKGQEAKNLAEQDNDATILRLKDGDSKKVRLLSPEDYVAYESSGDFENDIYAQPIDENSPLIKAFEEGGSTFKALRPKTRYLFAFADLNTGKIVGFDASKNQAKNIIGTIEEYREDLDDIPFTFKRTGEKTETTYSLNPIIKLKGDDKKNFEALDGTDVEMEFYEKALQPSTDEFLVKLLTDVDPSVKDKLFPDVDISEFDEDGDDAKKVDNKGSNDPLDII